MEECRPVLHSRFDRWTEECRGLSIRVCRTNAVAVLELTGELRLGEPTRCFRQTIAAMEAAGQNRVVLDLRQTTRLDSAGLGAITEALTVFVRAGGLMTIVRPSSKYLGDLLLETKLGTVASVFDRAANAIESLLRDTDTKTTLPAALKPPAILSASE